MTSEEIQDFCLILIESLQSNLMVIMHAPPERQKALMQSLARFATVAIRGLQQSNR